MIDFADKSHKFVLKFYFPFCPPFKFDSMKKCTKQSGFQRGNRAGVLIVLVLAAFAFFPNALHAQTPTITSFNPSSGAPGTVVTISGTNLGSPTAFTIGGATAIVESNTGSQLVGVVMSSALTGSISITTANGTAISVSSFTVITTPYPSIQQGSKLVGSGATGSASQGYSVSISADGNTAILGGYADNSNTGAAWIYTRSGNAWSQQGTKLVGAGAVGAAQQGASVSISADGNTAIIGAPGDNSNAGAVWIFTRSGGVWTQQGSKLTGTGATGAAQQGVSVSISADGNTAVAGGCYDNANQGAIWVYTCTAGVWSQQGTKLVGTGAVGNALQGYAIALSSDGNTLITGGYADNIDVGAVWIYTWSGTVWSQQGNKLVGTGATGAARQGFSVSISSDGNTAISGGYNDGGAGAAWVYTRSGTVWSQQGNKLAGTFNVGASQQGWSVSISSNGNTAVLGGPANNSGEGAVWVFTRFGSVWTQQETQQQSAYNLVGTGATGLAGQGNAISISADGTTLIAGGPFDNSNAGAAWVYTIAPPVINSFSPSSGAPGTLVTVMGYNLGSPTSFTIGGIPAIVISNTGTKLECLVMPGAVTGNLSLTTAGGNALSGSNFSVTATPYPVAQQGSKLVGTGGVGSAEKGYSVAISSDGNTAIVGGYFDNTNTGAAWIYVRSGLVWSQQGSKLVGTGVTFSTFFGWSVSISADGNTAIVGSSNSGVWIYTRSGTAWSQQAIGLVGTGAIGTANQGQAVSISADGNTAIVGGLNDNSSAGAVWVFVRNGITWSQQGSKLVGSGAVGAAEQGYSVAISSDGFTAIAGGFADNSFAGAAWVYSLSGGVWTQQGSKLVGTGAVGSADQGYAVALSSDGNTALVGGHSDNGGAGAAWVYTRSAGAWAQQGSKLTGTGATGSAKQGTSVSISADGSTAIIGGFNDNSFIGAAWVFTMSGGIWTQQGTQLIGTGAVGAPEQGTSVSISTDGTTTLIGGPDDNSNAGAVWVYVPSCVNPGIPTLATSSSTNCGAQSTILSIVTGVQNSATKWQWYSGSCGATSVGSGTAISVSPASTTSYYARGEGGCVTPGACSSSMTITVNPVPAAPTITPTGSTTFCQGDSVLLTSSAGTTYTWTTGATSPSIYVKTAGWDSLVITNSFGCASPVTSVSTSILPLPATPTITPDGPTTFCQGGFVDLICSAGSSYIWSNGDPNQQGIPIFAAGRDSVQVTDANGCTSLSSAAVVIMVNPLPGAPIITPNGSTTFCQGGGVLLTSSAGNSYSWSTGPTTASITASATGSYSLTIKDVNGCTSASSAPIAVTVNTLPVITCIADQISNTTAGSCNAIVNYSAPAVTGSPAPAISYSLSGVTTGSGTGTGTGSAFNLGVTIVTLTATNTCGAPTCSFSVTITDNVNPTITAPATVFATTNTGCTATGVSLGMPVTADNCSVASVVNDYASTTFPLGNTTVHWTVTDGSGNTATANQTVTVTDNVNPTITAPSTVNAFTNTGCTATGVSLGTPATADNCSVASVTNNALSAFPLGNTTVTWTVTDESGNTATATQTVTVTDNVNPTISAPAIVNAFTNTGCTATGVSLGAPVTADNCSVASVVNDHASSTYPLGNTTVTWTVTDGSGNTATATQTVAVTDNVNPTITAPTTVNAFTNTGCTATGVSLGNPGTADNCSVANVTNNAPSAFPFGNTTVIWTVTDGGGNTATANQIVTVTDNVNPTITAPATVSVFTNTGCTATGVSLGTPVTADNCSVANVINDAPSAFPLGNTTVTWTVTDGSGNTATATQMVKVTDNINPTIAAPATVNATTNTGCTATGVVLGTPVTADNCSVAVVFNNAPSAFPLGNTTVTWTVIDGSGNSATADQTVTVTDNIAPTITAPANVNVNISTGCTVIGVLLGFPNAADNCAVASLTNNAPSAFPLGNTTVTWTATDGSGNSATATQTVTVKDHINPTITAPADVFVCVGETVVLGTPVTADNCSVASFGNDHPSGTYPEGTTVVTWTVTDGSGNTATAAQNVTVNPLPTATITPGGPTSFCNGGKVTLTCSAGSSYLWSTGATTSAISVSVGGRDSVLVTDGNGCTSVSSAAIAITIIPSDNPSFSYSSPTICKSGSDPSPVISGLAGGLFTSSPAGLSLNASSGKITLGSSALATYNVTYLTDGTCPASSTVSVTITTSPDAAFTYSTAYCDGEANPFPHFTAGASAGVFSALPAGLVFVNTSTGEIDLAGSTPASYTISNNIAAGGGCSASAASFGVTISSVIAANAGSNAVICAGTSFTLAGVVGSSATGSIWTSSGTGVFDNAALPNAAYTPSSADIANGSVTLTLTATNAVSGIAPCNEGISSMVLTINICTGIATESDNYSVSVYPNPSGGNFVVTSSSAEQQLLQVFDVRGNLMYKQFLFTGSVTLDGNNLADGIYTISVTGSKGRINKRLIIVK